MEEKIICDCCNEKENKDDIHHIEIKGKIRKICKECATAITGFV